MKSGAKVLVICALSAMLITLTGCFSSNPRDIEAFLKPEQATVTAKEYVLMPPDEVEIHCVRVPEIHLQRQQIRPDGNITFEGIGDVTAAGKTPEQVAVIIQEKVSQLYSLSGDKPIDVRIATFQSKSYYVMGEVYLPGPKMYTGRDTVFSAVAQSRPTVMAWTSRIQVIRPSSSPDIEAKIFEYDLKDTLLRGNTSKNVLLQEGDIIYVPPTVLAWTAQRIEEFVRPIGRAFSTVNIINGPPQYR